MNILKCRWIKTRMATIGINISCSNRSLTAEALNAGSNQSLTLKQVSGLSLRSLGLRLPAFFLLGLISLPGMAQSGAVSMGPKDPLELEAFMDGLMAAHMKSYHVAGAVVTVVKGGEIFFSKGYGCADLEDRKPVLPDRTLFRIGSVSKLFTWTAIMQLAEQGRLDLNADVNRYLKEFKIPFTYPQPITLTHLLTHTPGFEDRVIGLFAHSPNSMKPLGSILAAEMPARIRPPGVLASYSNHGTALAGYIVAQISGIPWERYIEENILRPLEMRQTTLRQPLPDGLAPDMSVGYRYIGGVMKPGGFEFVPAAPAGSFSASASDIAKFMVAHLQYGRYASTRILEETTARKMATPLFSQHPKLNSMMYGFIEMNRNQQRIYGHGGDTILFHTMLMLMPDHNLGLFVSYNSEGGATARGQFLEAFLDRYFPMPLPPPPTPPADFSQRAAQFAGSYYPIRQSYTLATKIATLVNVTRVQVSTEGTLRIPSAGGEIKDWLEIEPLLFRERNGQEVIAFREEGKGHITHFFRGNLPMVAFAKMRWFETPQFHYSILASTGLLFLSALVGWPIIAFRRRRRLQPTPEANPLARFLGWLACLSFVLFAVLLVVALADPMEVAFGLPPLMKQALYLPLFGAVLTAAMFAFAIAAWRGHYWTITGRIHYTLVAIAAVAFLGILHYWNLLGFHY